MDAIVYDHQFNGVHVYLAIVFTVMNEPFLVFSDAGWFVLLIQAVVCQRERFAIHCHATQKAQLEYR
jgi:hypothetical protein